MKYERIDAKLFKENRERFISHLPPSSMAIFHSNDLMPRNGDQCHPFRQDSDLFYLTGVDQEDTVLIIFPDAPDPKWKEILFIRKADEHTKIWEGDKLSIQDAREVSGIQSVHWFEAYDKLLATMMNYADTIFLNLNENDRADSDVPNRNMRKAKELQDKYPAHRLRRAGNIMRDLRVEKSKLEVALIQHACNITEKAFRHLLTYLRPGIWEYEIEAEITADFLRNRANGHAYHPIIASGPNACVLHYDKNNNRCKDGDLLLLDFGADYANYASDMSRTVPVSGRFTKRQKAVYNACLRVMKEAIQMLQPGVILNDYNKEVGNIMSGELVGLGLLDKKDVANQNPEKPLYRKYFMHGTSHFLGIDTHDIGNRYAPIPEGAVLTCEPGIYIPEENIGIRLENDILVSNKGPVDLMKNIPLEAEEIEELMQSSVAV